MSLSQRLRTKNEATGMRVVAQYVQEFWECGWQQFDQRNDHGIDGLVIMRIRGRDLGANLNIQVKCGTSYISSISDTHLRICIDEEPGLLTHIAYWKKQIDPAILVFVIASKLARDKHGNILMDDNNKPIWYDSRLKAKSWWLNLKEDNIIAIGTKTIIEIPLKQTFGEHSKGEFIKLVRPLIDDNTLKRIEASKDARKLYLSDNIRGNAKKFYKKWKNENGGIIFCPSLKQNLIISRTGWLHITQNRRSKERRIISFRLLGVAKQIIEEGANALLLNQAEDDYFVIQKYGIKAKVQMKNETDKVVQVIVLKRKDKMKNRIRYWFYSVHHRR